MKLVEHLPMRRVRMTVRQNKSRAEKREYGKKGGWQESKKSHGLAITRAYLPLGALLPKAVDELLSERTPIGHPPPLNCSSSTKSGSYKYFSYGIVILHLSTYRSHQY